jgi:predicted nucleotidyltransferase
MFELLLVKIARALDKAKIPYMVIGGQAVLLHGEPRLTRDIDVTLGITPERLDHILPLINTIGLEALVDPESFARQTMVLPCQDPDTDLRVDFIFSFSPYEAQAIEHAQRVQIGKYRVKFATPEDLIIHKLVSGRPRDLEDVKSVLAKNPKIDMKYVRRWLKDFSTVLKEPLLRTLNALLKAMK